MKINKNLTVLCLLVSLSCFPFFVFGQDANKKTDQDQEIILLIEKGVNYKNTNQLNKAIETFSTALEKCKTVNDRFSEAQIHTHLGNTKIKQGNANEALTSFRKSLAIWQSLGKKEEFTAIYLNIGLAHRQLNQQDSSISFFEKAVTNGIRYKQEAEVSLAYNNIGSAYFRKNNLKKAIEYYQKALEIRTTLNLELEKAQSLNSLGTVYKSLKENQKALELFDSALPIAEKLNDQDLKASILNNIGSLYLGNNDYKPALEHYLQSLEIRQKLNDQEAIASSYNNIGLIFKDLNHSSKAMEYFEKALKIYRLLNDKQLIANSLNYMGGVAWKEQDYKKALEYFNETLKIRQEVGDKMAVAGTYNNIAMIYKNLDQSQKAEENYLKALEIYKLSGDYRNQASTYTNLAYLFLKDKKKAPALYSFTLAYQIRLQLNDVHGIGSSAKDIAAMHLSQKSYDKVLPFLETALANANKLNDRETKLTVYQMYAEYWETKKNNTKALEFYKLYTAERDLAFNQESIKKIAEMQVRFEAVQMEREIDFLNQDKKLKELEISRNQEAIKRQQITIALIVLVLAFILLFVFTLAKQNKKIKKAYSLLAQKNAEITEQKDKIERQSTEIEKQRDIATAQRDKISWQKQRITDSIEYAWRIQNAILPPESSINEILEDHFLLFKPRDIVSGDFYWLTRIGNKKIIVVADCTGHGVPGAFMSMLGISLLNEIINRNEITKPNEVLNLLRSHIIKSLHQTHENSKSHDGMDMALCIIEGNHLQFAGANNPLYLIRNHQLAELSADKMPVGVHALEEEDEFSNNELILENNDLIYLFTDGYADQFGGKDSRKLLTKNLKKILLDNHLLSMAEQKNSLEVFHNNWKGTNKQVDDILILGLKINL